jgi:tryptophanyl-tRNA synthetase
VTASLCQFSVTNIFPGINWVKKGLIPIAAEMMSTRVLRVAKRQVLPRQTQRLFSSSSRLSPPESESPETPAPPPEKKGKKVIFSGIQPTGIPHLGNYLGALKQWKQLQEISDPSTELMYCIVDLHAITVPRLRCDLSKSRRDMLAALLAIGLDPKRSTIFYQSTVPGHSELQWILSCTASTGYLSRMTQWKSKLQAQSSSSSLETTTSNPALKHGLFSYPILQAADILVHRATHVPVGEDQRQHLEFARECVTNFNHTYSTNLFTPPETILSPAKRVMSLRDPTQKMSKSDPNPNSVILLTDGKETIEKKIKSAVTDSINSVSYDPEGRKGVANLLEILSHLRGDGATPAKVAEEMNGMGLGVLKGAVVDAVDAELAPIREKFQELVGDRNTLKHAASRGMWKARRSAEKTMGKVKKVMGLASVKATGTGYV